jgi:Methylamine utilisation protein MauE
MGALLLCPWSRGQSPGRLDVGLWQRGGLGITCRLMSPHSGVVLALLALLALAGVSKLLRPVPTAGALRIAGLPSSVILVRLLGMAEVTVGMAGFITGLPVWALAASLLYGSFAVFVIYALNRRLPISSCGCFGATETPPSALHVIVNVTAVLVLLGASMFPIGPWGGIGEQSLRYAIPFVILVGAVVLLLYGLLAVLPLVGRRARTTTVGLSLTRRTQQP